MTFKKYPKVYRIDKDEVSGVLSGECIVEEKIDGANASIWLDTDGVIRCGSRNRVLKEGFKGFVDYANSHERIKQLLRHNPMYRLHGEWLVKHTISYNQDAYHKFYLYDISVNDDESFSFIDNAHKRQIISEFNLDAPQVFGIFNSPSLEELNKFVGQSELGDIGEGIVIKNYQFRNNWDNLHFAKIVRDSFQEDNKIAFKDNDKYADNYWEMYVANKYVTQARVDKAANKLKLHLDDELEMKHIPEILSIVYNDVLTEEIWDIQKKVKGKIDFNTLKRVCFKSIKQHFVNYLESNEK